MIKIMLAALVLVSLHAFSQTGNTTGNEITTIKTQYSKIHDGEVIKQNFAFSILGASIRITDETLQKTDSYKPLKWGNSGFNTDGYYCVNYNSDFEKNALEWAASGAKLRLYKFIYEKKDGKLLSVIEVIRDINTDVMEKEKIYYTEEGNNQMNGGNGISIWSSSLALLFINAASLTEINSSIIAAFKEQGEKEFVEGSKDIYMRQYKISNAGDIAVAGYLAKGDKPVIIQFLLRKKSADYIARASFMATYPATLVNGTTKWINSKTGISYELKAEKSKEFEVILVR